jgi:uncharacterized protein YcbX
MSSIEAGMSSIQPAQVTNIYRYPVKGLSAQPLPSGSAGTKLVEFCDRICELTSNVDEVHRRRYPKLRGG